MEIQPKWQLLETAVALQTSNELYMVDYLDANDHCQNPETLTQWYAKIIQNPPLHQLVPCIVCSVTHSTTQNMVAYKARWLLSLAKVEFCPIQLRRGGRRVDHHHQQEVP